MLLGRQFAEELGSALRRRRMQAGVQMLTSAAAEIESLRAESPDAASLLLLIAQWVDVGYRDHRLLDALLSRFPAGCRKKLAVDDYLRMRMVDGFRHFTTGELDTAIETLDLVLKTCCDIPDTSLAAWAHFWKGRAHRKKGEYEASLKDIVQAREMAQADHDEMFTSVIQIQESWLLFQNGMSRDALHILDRAESVLKPTDHYVALGNIESARGRIIRRS
jgi:tetratricopeptide (TPR) repeat protein